MAAAASRNKVLPISSSPRWRSAPAPSARLWRGASSVKSLFRSRPPVARRQVSSLAFVVEDGVTAQGPVVGGRVDLRSVVPRQLFPSPASLDPGALGSGRAPGRCFSSVCFSLLFGASVNCGSFKASQRWCSNCPADGGACLPVMAGGDGLRRIRPAQG